MKRVVNHVPLALAVSLRLELDVPSALGETFCAGAGRGGKLVTVRLRLVM